MRPRCPTCGCAVLTLERRDAIDAPRLLHTSGLGRLQFHCRICGLEQDPRARHAPDGRWLFVDEALGKVARLTVLAGLVLHGENSGALDHQPGNGLTPRSVLTLLNHLREGDT